MSARRVISDTKLEEPANPTYIDFPRGDGNTSTWPTNTTRIVDSEGQVNFFDPLSHSHSQSVRWRMIVASAIANDFKMAGTSSSATWLRVVELESRIVFRGAIIYFERFSCRISSFRSQ